MLLFFSCKAIQLLTPASAPVCQPVPKRESHFLENGDYLGRSESAVHLPADHEGLNGDEGLAVGFLH